MLGMVLADKESRLPLNAGWGTLRQGPSDSSKSRTIPAPFYPISGSARGGDFRAVKLPVLALFLGDCSLASDRPKRATSNGSKAGRRKPGNRETGCAEAENLQVVGGRDRCPVRGVRR
jgi:hypothetical protein